MSDKSGPSHFQALFEAAYEKQTGETLANHPLAEKLQSCGSVESVTVVLRQQTETSSEIRGKDKVLKPFKNVLSVLHKLSSAVNFGQHLGLPLPSVKVIHTGLGILLSTVKGVLDDYDRLADLFELVEHFLNHLDIYTKIPPTLQQGKLKALVKKLLLGGKDIGAVLQRLDRLTGDEGRVTAAQTLEVGHGLFQNMRDVVDDGKTSINHVRDALEIIRQLASDTNKSKRDKLEKDIRTWLSPPDPWKNYNIARKLRQSGSAAWFLQGNTFSEWKWSKAPGSLLWVHGKSGGGKSVLCSAIVEDIDAMRKAGLASLAFFYCDFREDHKKDLRGLLSSLLVQLCHQSDSYCDVLFKFYSEHANGSRYPGDDALAGCLMDLFKLPGYAPVYLIVDGLDECSNTSSIPSPRSDVLNLIKELIKSEISNLRICVTSRPEMDIKDALDPLIFRSVSLHDEGGQKNDIDSKNKRWKAEDKRLVIDVLTIPFSHFSVKELLTSARLAEANDIILRRYHTSETPHTLSARACLGHLLHLDTDATRDSLRKLPFNGYSAEYRVNHARPEDVSRNVKDGMKELFDPSKPHLAVCIGIRDTIFSPWERRHQSERPSPLHVTPLHYAALWDLHSIVELLINEHSQNVNSQDFTDSATPLHVASKRGQLEVARMLIEHGASVSAQNKDGQTPLHLVFLENWNPLYSHPEVARILIEHGADVSAQNKDSQTPLHLASQAGRLEVARMLIERGARVSAQNKDGQTPLHLVFLGSWDPIFGTSDHPEVARMLIERGADVLAQDKDGQTPLHLALQAADLEVARVLIERGASVSIQNKDGQTPLHLVSLGNSNPYLDSSSHPEVALMLIESGADVSAQDKDGRTPMHLASQAGQLAVIRMLLVHGADASAQI